MWGLLVCCDCDHGLCLVRVSESASLCALTCVGVCARVCVCLRVGVRECCSPRVWASVLCRLFNKRFAGQATCSLWLVLGHNIGAVTDKLIIMPRFPLPEKFSDGDFTAFKKSFNRVAIANAWTDEQKLSALPLGRHGRALTIFEKKEDTFKTIDDAFKGLEEEFDATSDKDNALKEFYLCSWGQGLDLDVYSQKLSHLLRKGLPSLGDGDYKRIVVNQFINGFPSHLGDRLRLRFSGKSPSLEDALAAAKDLVKLDAPTVASCAVRNDTVLEKINEISQKLESVTTEVASITSEMRAAKSKSGFRRQTPDGQMESDRHQESRQRRNVREIRCFNCSGLGHIARNCPSPRSGGFKSGNGVAAGRRSTPSLR